MSALLINIKDWESKNSDPHEHFGDTGKNLEISINTISKYKIWFGKIFFWWSEIKL